MKPLVTVICVCYNHEQFVIDALESVKVQTYPHVQLIIVDDGSMDGSAGLIAQWVGKNQTAQFLNLGTNHGYCKAFNIGLAQAKGDFIIDLAGDDMLLPVRIEAGVQGFLVNGSDYGVQFSDATYISTKGDVIGLHSHNFPHDSIPQGNIYAHLIQRYFICSPTMMIRKSILNGMGGYDEKLYYEDFDLWIQASRHHLFFYIPKELVQKRLVSNSLGHKQYARSSKQLESTYLVCNKIYRLNKTSEEKKALNKRIWYELKWNLRFLNLKLVTQYLVLLMRNSKF